jgi:hypothetical protein
LTFASKYGILVEEKPGAFQNLVVKKSIFGGGHLSAILQKRRN